VIGVGVYDGKPVRKGDTLLTLDDRELLIAFQEAKNQLIGAQVDYNLANKAAVDTTGEYKYEIQRDSLRLAYHAAEAQLEKGEVSRTVVDRLRRNYDAISVFTSVNRQDVIADKIGLDRAESEYENAKLKLSYATFGAPFNGVAADCSVQPGSYVQVGQTCMRVIDISKIRINSEVTETDLPKIRVGDEAKAKFVAFAGKTFEGRVMQVNPMIDLQKRAATVIVEIDNPSGTIKPGMYASLRIASYSNKNIVMIPKGAVLFRDNRQLVFIVRNGEAQWDYIKLGSANANYYEIRNGLAVGDTVVINGNYNLAHQVPVMITGVEKY
jgi:HlyD family secretion protein